MHLVESMAYAGQTPWHGLGHKLEEGDDWVKVAGMDWEIMERPVVFGPLEQLELGEEVDEEVSFFPNRKVLYRIKDDRKIALGIVSNRYKAVQPREVIEFYDNITRKGHLELHTAGVLKEGKVLWALASYDKEIIVGHKDVLKPHVLLVTGCDGSMATRCYRTTVRVVCNNTLEMSMADSSYGISIPHVKRFDADEVHKKMKLLNVDDMDKFQEMLNSTVEITMNNHAREDYYRSVFNKIDSDGNVSNEPQVEALIAQCESFYESGPGSQLESSRDTAWGALNAVTHHIDFNAGKDRENGFASSQFGKGRKLKSQALDIALAW